MPTDKEILNRGIKYLVIALPMFFFGPTLIIEAFKNLHHVLFIPVLGMGIILCATAVVLLFRGLNTILKSQSDQ